MLVVRLGVPVRAWAVSAVIGSHARGNWIHVVELGEERELVGESAAPGTLSPWHMMDEEMGEEMGEDG